MINGRRIYLGTKPIVFKDGPYWCALVRPGDTGVIFTEWRRAIDWVLTYCVEYRRHRAIWDELVKAEVREGIYGVEPQGKA